MKLFLLIILINLTLFADSESKYIYKYKGNAVIPSTRVEKDTGIVEVFTNEYIVVSEKRKIDILKEKNYYKGIKNNTDDEIIKHLKENVYKDLDIEKIKKEAFKKVKIYKIVEKERRWLDLNEYNKQMELVKLSQ